MPIPTPNPSSAKVVARRGIQILIRQQDGDVERSIFMCQPDITFGELFQDIKQKRSKSYHCSAVHVTGTNVNSTSVHKDCVEDPDTLLADICFNEDLYTKPPTVEFTVTEEQVAPPRIRKAATSTVSSSSITSSSSSSSNFKDSNVSSNISTNISSNSNNNSSSSIVSNSRNSMLDRSEFFSTSTAPISRIKMNRVAGTEPPQKIAYNSGKEIPFDHDEEKEMTVYTNGRNRKVYYGINGAPYYITDTGNRVYVTSAPQSVREQFLEIETARNAALLDLKSALDNKTSSSSSLSSGLHNSLSALSSMKRKSIMGRNIVEESLAYLSHDRPSVRSMIPLTVPVPAPPPFTRTIEDSASSSSDSDNDYVKQLKAASSSSSSSSATAPSAPAFRQTDLMQLKQPEPKRVERRADEALKEKEKEKEVLKMVPVAPRKPSIVMSFKSYQYRYAFECLHGKSSLLKPEANILWEKTFSKDAHQEECGAGLLDPVWGILSGNAAVFVMTPLIKSEGEERRKIMNKLDTCGLVSSTNECQVCILFRSAEYLVKDLKRLMRWNKRISETSTSTYKLQEVLDRLAALTDPDQDKEDASKEIFLVMFKKAAQVRLLKVKKEMSLKREQLADAKKREEANKEKGDEQEEGTGADHDRIDAEEDEDAEVKQKKEKVAHSPEQPKKKRSRSSSKEIVAAVEDDEEVEVVIVPYLKERNACDTILIDIPPLVLPEQPQDVEEEQEEEEASVAMSKESSASDIDSGDSSCASADESAMRRKSLSPTTSTSAALHEREGRQESTKRHRSSTGGGTGPVTSPRSKSGEEGSPAAAAVVAPPKKAGGGERKGISKSGLKKVIAEEAVVSVKVERRRESEGKLRKVEGKEASSDTLPSGGTVKKKKRKLSSCSLDDADQPSDPSSSSSHISDSASSPTAVTVTAGVSVSAASSSSAPLSSTGGTSNIDSGSDLSNSNSTLFDTHPSSMSQSNSNNNINNNINHSNNNSKRDDNRNYNSHAVNYNSSSSGGVGDYDRYGSYMVNTNSNTRFNNIDNNRDSRDNSYFNAPMTGVDNHCLDFNANINFDPHGYSNLMGGVMSVNPNSIQQGNSGIGNFRLNNVNNIHMGNNSIRNVNNVNSNANSGMINNSMIMGSGINSSMNSSMGNMNSGIPNGLYNNVAYSGIANNNNNNSSDYSSKVNTHNPNIDYYNYDFAPNDPSYQYLHPIEHNCSTYDNLLYTYDIKTSRNVVDEKMYRSDKVIFRDISNGRETRTTLMARGISVKYQLSELWQDLHSQLRNKFDFINCPPRPGVLGENMGYFVINLRSPKHIHAFVQGFLQMKLFPSSMLNDNQESHRAVSFCTFQRTARTAEEREVPKAPPRPPPPPPPPLPLYDPPIAATPTNKDKKRLKMAEYHDKKKKERMDRKERRNSLASENDTEGKRADGTYEDEEEYNEEVDSDSNSPPLSSHTKDTKNDPPSKLKSISSSSMKVIDRDAPSVLSASTPFQSPSAAAYLPQPSSSATAAVKASKHVIFEESIEIEPMKEVKPKKKRVEAVKTSSKKDLAKEEEEDEEAAPATRIVKDKGKEKEKVKEKKEKVKVEEEDDEEDKEKEKEKTSKKSKAKQSERADGVISDQSKRERESSKKELAASSSLPDPGSDSVPSSELPLPEDSVKQKKRPKDTARASEAVDASTAKPSKRKLIEVADIPLTKYVNEESESDQITTRGREAEGDADINNIVSPRRKRVKESVVLTEGKGDGDGDGSRDVSGTVEGASAACVVDMTAIPADGEGLLKRVRGGKGRGKDAITGAPAAASSFNAIVVGKRGEIRRDTRKPVSKEAVPALPKQPPLKITVDRRPRADAPNCEEAAVKETGKDKVKQKMKDKVEKVKPAVEESGGERDAEARDREKVKEKEKEKKLTSEPPQEQKEQGKSKAESKTVKKEATDSVIDAEKDKEAVREKKADKKQDALGDAGERKGLRDNKEAFNEGENAGKTSSGNKSEDGKKAAAVETEKEKDRKGREGVSEEKCPDWGMSDILSAIEKRERRASLGAGSEITEKKEKRRDSDGAREHTASLQRDRDRDISKGKAIPPQPLVHETMPSTESKSKYQPDSNTRNRSQGMQEGGVRSEGKDRDNSTSRPSEGPRSGFSTDFTFEDSDMPSKPPCTPTAEVAATATHTASDYHSKDRDREGERDRGSTSVRAGQDTVSGSRRRSTSTTGGPLEQTENIVRNLSNTTSNANMQDAYSRGKSEGSTSTSSEAKKIKSEGNMSGSKVSSSTSKNASNSTNRPRADSSSGYRGRDRDCSSGSKSATAHSSGASNRSQNHSSGDVIQSVKAEMMSGSNSHSRTQSLKKELFKPLTRDGWAASGPQSTPLAPIPGGTQHGWVQSMVTGTWGVDGPVGGASGNSAAAAPQVPLADPSALTSNPPKPFPPQPFDPKELVYPVESTHTHF